MAWIDWTKISISISLNVVDQNKKNEEIISQFFKKMISLDKKETQRLELELSTLVNDLANGKRDFKKVQRDLKNCKLSKYILKPKP